MATYTYSGDPSSSALSEIRFIIGDVGTGASGETEWLLSDEEINYVYGKYPGILEASIVCVSAIIAKVARYAEEITGDVAVKWQQVFKQYQALKKELQYSVSLEGSGIYLGGISISDKDEVNNDTDRVPTSFDVNMGTDYFPGSESGSQYPFGND